MRISTFIVALIAMLGLGGAVQKADAQIVLSVGIAPPPLPVYVQPEIPGPGYIWTPGYWAWDAEISEYYWVPGAWVLPPRVGLLWTPGYWGWSGGEYVWNAGYWGPTVGFYGGICYGYGYTGVGFSGGYWSGDRFYYNRAVTNISHRTDIDTVYHHRVIDNRVTDVSYNGGDGGVRAQPTSQELLAARDHHIAPTNDQLHHQTLAIANRDLRASVNHGRPAIAAVARAGDFSRHNVVPAQAAGGHIRPASLPAGNALGGPRPGGRNPMGPGNAFAARPYADPSLAPRSNGAAGARHFDPSQGPNRNAGPYGQHNNFGSSAAHVYGNPMRMNGAPIHPNGAPMMGGNGAPTHMNGPSMRAYGAPGYGNGAPFRANGAPMHMNGAGPNGAAMMRMPGGPAPRMQAPANMPRPAAQPRPAAPQPKRDQHHG